MAALLYLTGFIATGAISDRITTTVGRRKPFILLGSVLSGVSLIQITLLNDYYIFAAWFLLLVLSF